MQRTYDLVVECRRQASALVARPEYGDPARLLLHSLQRPFGADLRPRSRWSGTAVAMLQLRGRTMVLLNHGQH